MDMARDLWEQVTPRRMAVATGLGLFAIAAWKITGKITKVKNYWEECKSDAVTTKIKNNWAGGKPVEWFRLNDVIMGGRSSSEVAVDKEGRLVFTGTISTIGGGFAAVRTTERVEVAVPPGATAIRIVAEGDGQMWKVTLGTTHGLMASKPTYTHDFLTTKGVLEAHTIPLKDFVPQKRGQQVGEKGLPEGEAIAYVGVILSLKTQAGQPNPHFGDGPFRFVLHEAMFVGAEGEGPAGLGGAGLGKPAKR